MADKLLQQTVRKLLRLKPGTKDILQNREGSELEFKESFNISSRAKYAKTMAAFANNKGGYLVFGVAPTPHRIKGVNPNFDECDPADITRFLNSTFSPELAWEMETLEIFGIEIGFMYTYEAREKPVVTIANQGDTLKEGSIYYRYRGQSTPIKFPELRTLLDERIARERKAWMQHFDVISRAGPTNVGILDTIHGRLYGGGPPFLIDEKLLRQLKFIRRGKFSESSGEPTLRLLGDVQSIEGSVEREVSVPTGIHAEDLITAFLAQRPLAEPEARTYLRETTYQNSPYVPLHYFANASGLSHEEIEQLIKSSQSSLVGQKNKLLQRLSKKETIKPLGSTADIRQKLSFETPEDLKAALDDATTHSHKRAVLLAALRQNAAIIHGNTSEVPPSLLCEAVTHLKPKDITGSKLQILELLLAVFVNKFAGMPGIQKTVFRKAVAYCDETLARLND